MGVQLQLPQTEPDLRYRRCRQMASGIMIVLGLTRIMDAGRAATTYDLLTDALIAAEQRGERLANGDHL